MKRILFVTLIAGFFTAFGFVWGYYADRKNLPPYTWIQRYRYGVIEYSDGFASFSKEAKEFRLDVRDWLHPDKRESPDSLKRHKNLTTTIDPSRAALVLVDVRQDPQVLADHAREHIVPLRELCRKAGIRVIHLPHGRETIPELKPLPDEVVVPFEESFMFPFKELTEKLGITTLIYCGYAANGCLLYRPLGLYRATDQGYGTILVRDAIRGWDIEEDPTGEAGALIATYVAEDYGTFSTTVADLRKAIEGTQSVPQSGSTEDAQ